MKVKKMKKGEKGITLLVLVVTMIVLLILAAVAIKLALDDNGVIGEAKLAANEWDKAGEGEQSELSKLAKSMRDARNGIYSGNSGGNTGDNSGGENNGGNTGDNTGGGTSEKPTFVPSTTEPEASVSFVTEVGKIDVIWLDTNNRIIDKPNSPADHLGGMKPVKWNGTTEEETTSSDSDWYSYTSIEGDEDNNESKWANAKNFGSYFVWIPRYAYRITYYDSSDLTEPTGYYDGCGMWKSTGELKLSLEEGIETVVKNGKSYIVHPAFIDDSTNGYSNGGWDSDLAGIWVGKYESSRSDATTSSVGTSDTIKVVPGVRSLTGLTIGNCYTSAYNYERTKESHLIKNSEWGATAYLTHSQYGRNGHSIGVNISYDFITGKGTLASSTGNMFGVFDLSGGAQEYTSSYVYEWSELLGKYESFTDSTREKFKILYCV